MKAKSTSWHFKKNYLIAAYESKTQWEKKSQRHDEYM